MTEHSSTRSRLIDLFTQQMKPDADVDWEKVMDAFGFSSLQVLAFLKSVNAEFGTNITPEDVANANGDIRNLLPSGPSMTSR